MSHSTSRTRKSPVSGCINSLKSSEEFSTTAYFKSKLFRGKSASNTSNSSGHLHSLRELNNLKTNHNLHTLSYNQLNRLIPPTNQPVSSKKAMPKVKSTSAMPTTLKASYGSLDPGELQEDVPKKREKHTLPSEQRQILIQRYQLQSESLHTNKPLNTLDYIWHETLTNPVNQDNHAGRTSTSGSKEEFIAISQMIKNTQTQGVERWPNYIRDGNKEPHFINKGEHEVGKSESEMFMRKSMTSDGPYGLTTKQMESLTNSLKDFHKLLSYTQQSYQKAKTQQTHLSNFVSTFIKEVDQIERIPKTLNAPRLNLCITSIQNKIDELTNEKELVKEQLAAIRGLIDGKVPQNPQDYNKNSSPSPLLLNERRSSLKGYGSSMVSLNSQRTRPGSAVPYSGSIGPRFSVEGTVDANGEKIESTRDRLSLDHLQTKTKELKTDVAKLQKERLSYQEGRKAVKIKVTKRKTTEDSPTRATGLRNFNDSPESEFSYKVDLSPSERLSIPANLVPLNEPTPKEADFNELNDYVDDLLPGKGQSPFKRQTLTNVDDLFKNQSGDDSDSAFILYEAYSKTLIQLEERLRKRLGEMKLFQKDADEVYTSDTKLLTLQINYCFENLTNEYQNLSKDFESRGKVFLRAVAEKYERFLKLSDSNLLKLISIKNIIVSSVNKLKKLERFCSKFSQLDLTDKFVRKTFDAKYLKLKQDLQGDRKTLLFLTDQFNRSIAMYRLNSMQNPSAQDVAKLVEQSRMLLRVIYNLEKFPTLEDDFNEKSTTAYSKCKIAAEIAISLREAYRARGMMPAEQYKEAEDCLKSLESLHVRLFALQNEMTMLSKLGIFEDTIKKPLLIVTKLVKKMSINHKELKELMEKIKEDLIVDYRSIIHQSEDTEHQLEGHMKRMLQDREHLNFFIWIPNHMLIEGLREELVKATVEVARYAEEKYPPSIALIPKPQEKLHYLQNLEKVVESLLKTLATGKVFETWQSREVFEGITTNTLDDKLKETYDRVQEEIADKEKILLTIENASELFNKIVGEVLEVLMQLRFILNKTFELQQSINGGYQNFQEEHMGKDLYLLNPSAVLDKHKEKYPRFFSQLSIEGYDLGSPLKEASPSTAKSHSSRTLTRWKSFKRQFTMGLVKMLPEIENAEGEYPNKMTGFIEKMKSIFEDYCGNTLTPYADQHFLFKQFYNKLKDVCNGEISLLERAQRAVYNVQVNHIFYNREIRPLTHLHKYLYVLNHWSDKIGGLTAVKDSMNLCLEAVTDLEEEGILRGGIEIQVVKYRQIQTMLCNSINIIIDLLTLGTQLNEREISGHLGHSLRVEEGGLGDFIKTFQRRFRMLYESYETNSDMVEEDTGKLVESFQDFVESLLSVLSLAQEQYIQLFRTISDGLRPHDGSFLGYIGKIYTDLKIFSEEFDLSLEEISKLSAKPTWLTKTLEAFYRNIVQKDLVVFARLYEETKKLSGFIDQIKIEFINKELKDEARYKNTEISNPSHCDRYAARCDIYYKSLNEFCGVEEIICRPELKSIIGVKLKEVQSLKKGIVIFAIVYSMGRKLNDSANAMIEKTSIMDIYESLIALDDTVEEMLKHLYREVEEAKALDRDFSALTMSVNLERILREEILVFYLGVKKFLGQLKGYLSGIYQFYEELKKKYKNQVFLLRDDWISLIKECVPINFVSPNKKVNKMQSEYVQFSGKMNKFVEKLKIKVKSSKHTIMEVTKKVEFLNEYFLNDWFFNASEEEREAADKLFVVIHKLVRNINQKKYQEAAKLRHKVIKIANFVETCSKCVRDLSEPSSIKPCFEEIRGWSNVIEHYNKQNIGAWKGIMAFVLAEVLAFNDEQEEMSKIKEQVQTVEEMYALVEQNLGCKLTEVQQEFLQAIFKFV